MQKFFVYLNLCNLANLYVTGPVELIHHHMDSRDGIITKLEIACDRSNQQLPIAFRGMTYHDLEQELMRKAESIRVGSVVPYKYHFHHFETVLLSTRNIYFG